ncbi:DNA polymerase III, delta subunit [Sporobacter termitidis DSM 10068]|uniref:DNA polymerase III subunit delta n=1 Tax=Sporobacter termitidis DSM 10068 TaxID=1123282 RepID=A0A1M5TT23_9FIRM|nr:DNA polymerase III subunit delta [Sporobacter termitidis]SHH53726.1 DNA polymerase III, delta subunit [Sporobacter termitidis DSM 10068]
MAPRKNDNLEFEALKTAVAAGQPDRLYVFHGEERYLLENYLEQIRKCLTGTFSEFNYRRYEGQGLTADTLAAACDTLPAFAERTLIEVHDFDLFKGGEDAKQKLIALLSDLPDYACLIFVCDTIEWKPDGRQKLAEVIKKNARVVEFPVQEQSKVISWIKKHFASNGRTIDTPTAEHLAVLTGGLMTALNQEIEKVCDYTGERVITRAHLDAVVTPVLDAVVYKLTDHIAAGSFSAAAGVLYELFCMHEPPQLLIYSITLKLRQLLAARLCYERGLGEKDLMKLCAIRFEFQARNLLSSARKTTVPECRRAVLLSAETAHRMITVGDAEARLTELLIQLAENRRRARA